MQTKDKGTKQGVEKGETTCSLGVVDLTALNSHAQVKVDRQKEINLSEEVSKTVQSIAMPCDVLCV